MLITHWSVNDQTSAFLVVDTLDRVNDPTGADWPSPCGQSPLELVAAAGATAHPFYGASFALIGEGRSSRANGEARSAERPISVAAGR
jgi:CHAT domain-containing protein